MQERKGEECREKGGEGLPHIFLEDMPAGGQNLELKLSLHLSNRQIFIETISACQQQQLSSWGLKKRLRETREPSCVSVFISSSAFLSFFFCLLFKEQE
jgi:hypothetical protein